MKKFASYLVPSLIASVLMSMYAIVDGIFIGQKIGDSGLAAINITWPVTSFLQSIGTAMGLAGGILVQNLLGKKDVAHANRIKSTVLIMVLILGVGFGILFYAIETPLLHILGTTEESFSYAKSYLTIILMGSVFQMLGMALLPLLKNSGKVKRAACASLSAVFTNLILDYVLIFVADMDLAGAALASVLAQVVSCLICMLAYFKELKKPLFMKKDIVELFKTSLAPFILAYSFSIAIIITNLVCSYYGRDEAVAAYTLLSYLSYIIIAIACAVGDSIQPLFSYNQAVSDYKSNKRMLKYCLGISFGICGICVAFMLIFQNQLGELYNLSNLSTKYYKDGLIYYSIAALCVSLVKVVSSYLYAINSKLYANILVMIEPFVLIPLGLLIFCLPMKLSGVWVSYLFTQGILVALAGGLLYLQHKKIFQNSYS
ncbi:MAG: MATE family efflux transporter [Anaeroplasmataceae bacterium]|nr:MATE family efflux transporter [Anaeroplasmataceae bacterium]